MDKRRLIIGPIKPVDVVAARKAMWAGWIEDCERVRDEWVEARLIELTEGLSDG